MELKFTNKGIENIIHAKNGIKLNLKGYAIYADDITENIKTLSDIDLDKVICKSKVNSINELCNNLYELNYIPSLEDTYVTNEALIERGYDHIIQKLTKLWANIKLVEDQNINK